MTQINFPYQAQTPQSISPTSQPSPQLPQYNGAVYSAYYPPPPYNPYAQAHRFGGYAPVPTQHYFPASYPQPQPPSTPVHTLPSVADTRDQGAYNGPSHERPETTISNTAPSQSPPMANGKRRRRSSSSTRNGTQTGPIKAAGPVVVRRDSDGTPWITVEYTKDRLIKSHQIRIDTETINIDHLSYEFKARNVVYPAVFKGVRMQREKYETECNRTAWALAKLNPILETSKGLRQRAVDHWRNSNMDRSKASRRVRRDAKKARRFGQVQASLPSQMESANGNVRTLPGQKIDDNAASLSRQWSEQSMGTPQYAPLNTGKPFPAVETGSWD